MAYLQHLGARVVVKVRTGDERSTAGELHIEKTFASDITLGVMCEGFASSCHAGSCQRGCDQERAIEQTHVQRYSPQWKMVVPEQRAQVGNLFVQEKEI